MSEAEYLAHIEEYARALLTEEIGEAMQAMGRVLQLLGKAGRFGIDTPGVLDFRTGAVDFTKTPRTLLAAELGDVGAAIEYLLERGIVDAKLVDDQRARKLAKLLDPNSRDNLGKRLAP